MIRKFGTATGPIVAALGMLLGSDIVDPAAARAQDEGKAAPKLDVPEPEPVTDITLDRLPTYPIRRGQKGANVQFVDTTLQPSDRAPRLEYEEQSANFTLNQSVKGSESGASALISGDLDNGPSGTLTLARLVGEFRDGEEIRDAKGGTAKVKGGTKPGIWVLDFSYRPIRVKTVEIPGKGRRDILYLYYKVINHTGKPRPLVPQFTLVLPENGRSYQDVVLPNSIQIIKLIETREDPSIPLQGAVNTVGMVPVSSKEGIDDAVFGVAMWEVDPAIAKADRLQIYVRGLSDGYKRVPTPEGSAQPDQVRYKTLRIDFDRPGDEFQLKSHEFRPLDPPYQWIYW
ncbi:MAG: hypothetical protein U0800_21855 [Isosphaeraceae bacterium]